MLHLTFTERDDDQNREVKWLLFTVLGIHRKGQFQGFKF